LFTLPFFDFFGPLWTVKIGLSVSSFEGNSLTLLQSLSKATLIKSDGVICNALVACWLSAGNESSIDIWMASIALV
jgi:hypothetical protein